MHLNEDAIGYDGSQPHWSKVLWRAALMAIFLVPAGAAGCALLVTLN